MDPDPELDIALSDGRQVVTFRIAALSAGDGWVVVEPWAPRRVVRAYAAALALRRRFDVRIAARLAAGWVPVEGHPAKAPIVPAPLPPDLALQIGSLVEALACAGPALRAADPSGQLWAACHVLRRQAQRVGIGAPGTRRERARRERRLGELAEQAGNLPAAILHYQAALASHRGAGLTRRLARLMALGSPAAKALARREPVAGRPARAPQIRLDSCRGRSGDGHAGIPPAHSGGPSMKKARIQIVGRLPVDLSRRVRAAAKRQKLSLNTLLIDALTRAVETPRRVPESKETSHG